MSKYHHIQLLLQRYPELAICEKSLHNAVDAWIDAYKKRNKLLICGNGGSAADADHIVGELMKGFVKKRPLSKDFAAKLKALNSVEGEYLARHLQMPLRAINLSQHPSLNTAFSNDAESVLCYAQQVLGYADSGDIFIGISTSGNSENICMAALVAKEKDAVVVALTGENGGRLGEISDILINVPRVETYQIQELHLPVYHALCLEVESHFFAE